MSRPKRLQLVHVAVMQGEANSDKAANRVINCTSNDAPIAVK
jgi:hypothetical protein